MLPKPLFYFGSLYDAKRPSEKAVLDFSDGLKAEKGMRWPHTFFYLHSDGV
ncbi:hypothetical protein HMPREF9120_00729 [Neisseria sp. oral taxon 020 str. F0370]|nr:hypothetical protein HMPREF9120_00729 [Neisseria sp. oral taxon 020 str. F0370]